MGYAGGSADEQAKRLIHEAGAWAAGAEGERRVATALEALPDTWTVVHDRLLRPGRSDANLDHVAVGPSGVFLIDSKNRAGRVTEHEGGLFQHRMRAGSGETVSLAAELKKVHGMATYMTGEVDAIVTPVLCLAGRRADEFGEPRIVRGVWVVPLGVLSGWLRARPFVIPSDSVSQLATRVITEFPSTTTDPALLGAIGGAQAGRRPERRGSGRSRRSRVDLARPVTPPRRPRRFLSLVGGLIVLAVAASLALTLVAHLPATLTAGARRMAGVGHSTDAPSARALVTEVPTGKPTSAAKRATPRNRAATPAAARPLGPPDCSDATAAEIKAIIHRTVKPVVTRQGCAWGTRLDDSASQLVTIVMTEDHAAYDLELTTSVKQERVVFGGAYDTSYRPATRASVASGQWILRGAKPVRARADTVVVVSTAKLGVSDDKARAMAVSIAAAANSG